MFPSTEYIKNISSYKEKHIRENFPDFYQYIINTYKEPFIEALYLYINNLSQPPVCEACGSPVKFLGFNKGYNHYCSSECFQKNAWYDKFTQSNIKRLGVAHHFQLKEYRDKAKQTIAERYGDAHAMRNSEIKNKFKQSCKEKYGVDWYTQTDSFKEKAKHTNLKKRGVEFPMQLKEIRDQANSTNIERYGGTGFASLELLQKAQDTYFKRTGKEWNDIESCLEEFVANILDKNHIEYIKHNRSILSHGKELDIFIPSKNIAIECNGCFWHSSGGLIAKTEFVGNIKPYDYHIQKYKECLSKNIQLITLWEDQIKNQPQIVESLLLSKLGIYKERIYARKCEVLEISSKECAKFLEENHIQRKTKTNIRLGLFHNNSLIGVMTFSTHSKLSGDKKSHENEWELSRFCTKLNTQVVGGADKLLKYFINQYNPKYIVSFSSNDISNGSLYKRLGFISDNKISNAYWYIKINTFKRYHRSTFSKTRLKQLGIYEEGKTESEIMDNQPYMKIYDSGHIKWILNL